MNVAVYVVGVVMVFGGTLLSLFWFGEEGHDGKVMTVLSVVTFGGCLIGLGVAS